MIVMKFGGTSIADASCIARVAGLIASRRRDELVVVTSAMAGVTNTLEDLLTLALAGQGAQTQGKLDSLRVRHLRVASILAAGDELLVTRLERLVREVRVLLRGVRLLTSVSPRSRDAILGYGELMAQEVLAVALRHRGVDAQAVYAGEILITDDHFGAARPDAAQTRRKAQERLLPLVAAGRVPVLGGYLGATKEGIPTTLGRGGSDLSASLFALALDARAVEIWTDVDGLMTADPRLIPEARLVRHASFREAAELAGFGAKVLHPAAIDPAVEGGLAVVIRNSLAPEGGGTRIDATGDASRPACAVASRSDVALICLRSPGLARDPRYLARLGQLFEQTSCAPLALVPGPIGIDLLVPSSNDLDEIVAELARDGRVSFQRELGLVALVGDALSTKPSHWRTVLEALSKVPILRLVQGPGGTSLGAIVAASDLPRAARTLHAVCFEQERTSSS